MNRIRILIFVFLGIMGSASITPSHAAHTSGALDTKFAAQPWSRAGLQALVVQELERLPQFQQQGHQQSQRTRIRLNGSIRIVRELSSEIQSSPETQITGLRYMGESSPGEAHFRVEITTSAQQASSALYLDVVAPYSALMMAPIAVRRIQPRERLNRQLFVEREIDVAKGVAREYRGLILAPSTNFDELEAKQTILEGQYPISSGVVRVPDVRQGDSVQLRLVSGGLTLTTMAIAEESASVGGNIRILSRETKKQMIGRLKDRTLVEVNL